MKKKDKRTRLSTRVAAPQKKLHDKLLIKIFGVSYEPFTLGTAISTDFSYSQLTKQQIFLIMRVALHGIFRFLIIHVDNKNKPLHQLLMGCQPCPL